MSFFFYEYGDHRGLHSFPTRRSSDLEGPAGAVGVRPPVFRHSQCSRGWVLAGQSGCDDRLVPDRKSTRLNSSHVKISYAVFCLKKKKKNDTTIPRTVI